MQVVSIILSFLVTFVTCSLFILWWRRQIRKSLEINALLGRLKTEVNGLITEINGTTDRNIALIENRIQAINKVIDQATRLQKVLETEKIKQSASENVYTELARKKPLNIQITVPEESNAPAAPADEPPAAVLDKPLDILVPAETEATQMDFNSLSLKDKVLILHRRGEPRDAIAENMKMSRGEVELIISLHDRKG